MSNKVKDEATILQEHADLTANVAKLTTDLQAEKKTSTDQAAEITRLKGELATANTNAEKATKDLEAANTELGKLRTENAELKSKDADVDKRAAEQLVRIGIREVASTKKEEPARAKTATELCIEAKEQEAAAAKK